MLQSSDIAGIYLAKVIYAQLHLLICQLLNSDAVTLLSVTNILLPLKLKISKDVHFQSFIPGFCAYELVADNVLHAETARPAAKRRKKKPASGASNTSSVQSGSPTAARQKKSPGPVMFGSVVEV